MVKPLGLLLLKLHENALPQLLSVLTRSALELVHVRHLDGKPIWLELLLHVHYLIHVILRDVARLLLRGVLLVDK